MSWSLCILSTLPWLMLGWCSYQGGCFWCSHPFATKTDLYSMLYAVYPLYFLNNFFVVVQKACSLNKKPKEREYFRIFLLLIRPRQVSTSFARDSSCLRFLDYYRLRRWIVKMSTYFKHLEYGMSPERLHPWYTSSDERGFLFIQGCIQLCLNRRNCSWANDSNPTIMHPYLC